MPDLLNPGNYRDNYISQVRETIRAYSIPLKVLGEGLQNGMDAIEHGQPQPKRGEIAVHLNFDQDTVSILDNGSGFPNDPMLLFLGGGKKKDGKQRGRIGVGIKVTLFSSRLFRIRARTDTESWQIEVADAYNYETLTALMLPDKFDPDPTPLKQRGTLLEYGFPIDPVPAERLMTRFVLDVTEECFHKGPNAGFAKHLQEGKHKLPSPLAAALVSYLRRYSYLADVLNTLQNGKKSTFPAEGISVKVKITCNKPKERFAPEVAKLFGDRAVQEFTLTPSYLLASESCTWSAKPPGVFSDRLGKGGENIEKTDGLNVLRFFPSKDHSEFEQLVTDKRGHLPPDIEEFRQKLFPYLNGVVVTLGRIPYMDTFLPGGSRRIIAANGIPTEHEIDFVQGRNQEYVRCFDLVVDVDAMLNYGKTHLTDLHLVNRLRRFLNEAYARVIQNAAGKWVGVLPSEDEEEDEEHYVGRDEISLAGMLLRSVPHSENDVIALFFELAKFDLWKDYRVFGLSGKERYDGRAAIRRPCDKPAVLEPADDTKLRSIEFKLYATEIIRDFERKQKWSKEVKLVIAWDEGSYTSQQYKLYDIEHSSAYKAKPSKVFPHGQKYIYDSREGAEVQVLLLQPIVAGLAAQAKGNDSGEE